MNSTFKDSDILKSQSKLIKLYHQYQKTDRNIIATHLHNYITDSDLTLSQISEQTCINANTIQQAKKFNTSYKPNFEKALLLCNALEIPITDIIKPTEIYKPKSNTKWTEQAKQRFISEYMQLPLDEFCNKYSISKRTADEYYRRFNQDLEYLQQDQQNSKIS